MRSQRAPLRLGGVVVLVAFALLTMHSPPCLDDHPGVAAEHMDGSACLLALSGIAIVVAGGVSAKVTQFHRSTSWALPQAADGPDRDRSQLGVWII